jgi:leucyl aminopeptidase
MNIKINKITSFTDRNSIAILTDKDYSLDNSIFSEKEKEYVQAKISRGENFITINQYKRLIFLIIKDASNEWHYQLEDIRKAGCQVQAQMNIENLTDLTFYSSSDNKEDLLAFLEGILLGSYRFEKYVTQPKDKTQNYSLNNLEIISDTLVIKEIEELQQVVNNLYEVRNLVNEPVSHLNAQQLAERIKDMCMEYGCKVNILNKSQIESLKMGGLLAVNKGSVDPPTFTVVEWHPDNAINKNPYILVGKGIVYDTGGLTLKPTTDSMDYMKTDMSGAAIVGGVVASVAANKLPIYVVALMPATDNRPSGNAYAPGDVVTLMDGSTVEVMNSDAEGRMILADALIYAQNYNPELVIDVATLTGAASMAIGPYALVSMGTAPLEVKNLLLQCGNAVFERMVEFPLWKEYGELLKSDIADIRNVGGRFAGAITAGKFLERYAKYPWMHLDIAGVAFNKSADSYRGKGGTGFGVRLLYKYFKELVKNK